MRFTLILGALLLTLNSCATSAPVSYHPAWCEALDGHPVRFTNPPRDSRHWTTTEGDCLF